MKKKEEIFSTLRKEAEKLLVGKPRSKKSQSEKNELTELLHEIQVYQVELEMQNDELKLSQIALEREKLKFVDLFNLAPVGYFILNHLAVIEQCNENALLLLQTSRHDTINKRFQSYIVPEDSDAFHLFIRKLLQSRTIQTCQVRLFRTGQIIYTQLQGTIIQEADSSQVAFHLSALDITDKKIAEKKEKEIKERLQMALAASYAGTWKVNFKEGAIFIDDFVCGILAIGAGEFDGKYSTLLSFIHPADRAQFDLVYRSLSNKPSELHYDCRVITKNNELKYIEIRGHTVKIPNLEDDFIGILTDITKSKVLELEAIQLKANQQKQILRTVIETQEHERQRISTALHDSVGQLLYATSLKLQHSQTITDKSFQEATRFLDLAIRETRNISFELAPSILTDFGLVVAVPEMAKRLISPNLVIKTEISGFDKRLSLTAETFIFRIIQELLNNVIKHSGASETTVVLKRKNTIVNLIIKDNGVGFSQSKKLTNGTGLSSIKNRIALYAGLFKIRSRKNKGTTITIQLSDVE